MIESSSVLRKNNMYAHLLPADFNCDRGNNISIVLAREAWASMLKDESGIKGLQIAYYGH
jgi:hypothetical protein